MEYGHIKISRKVFDGYDDYWPKNRPFTQFEAWVDLLQMAAWKRTKMNGVVLERGQVLISVRYLSERWKWGKNHVQRWIERAKKCVRITGHQTGRTGTVYTIVNYDTYQSNNSAGGTDNGTEVGTEVGQKWDTSGTKKNAVKQLSSTNNSPTQRVLDHYQATHPRRQVGDEKQRKLVDRMLKIGFTPDDLCNAISGNANDPWHRERRKHELSYVLRDADHINSFIEKHQAQQEIVDPEFLP